MVQWLRIRLPTQEMQETWVRSLGREDPLEKEMAICSSILAWKIPWTEEPGGLQAMRLDMNERLNTHVGRHSSWECSVIYLFIL